MFFASQQRRYLNFDARTYDFLKNGSMQILWSSQDLFLRYARKSEGVEALMQSHFSLMYYKMEMAWQVQ